MNESHRAATPLSIILMATGPFALPTMRWLVDSHHDFTLWITRPPRPSGRRQQLPHSPLRELARERAVPTWEPEDINASESIERLREAKADVFIVCDYGRILSADVLAAARLGGINLHGSLLPKYRGAAPVQWALFHGESETGVSVIHMSPKLDAGPILAQIPTKIDADEDAVTLERRLAEMGVAAVEAAIDRLAAWDGHSPLGTPQDDTLATPAPRLRKEHGRIDFSRTARQIVDQVRAMRPWPGTFTQWERKPNRQVTLRIEQAQVVPESALEAASPQWAESPPGTVLVAQDDRLWVQTGRGILSIVRLCPAGKRSMAAAEFLRGYRIEPGTRLGLPDKES